MFGVVAAPKQLWALKPVEERGFRDVWSRARWGARVHRFFLRLRGVSSRPVCYHIPQLATIPVLKCQRTSIAMDNCPLSALGYGSSPHVWAFSTYLKN